MFAKKHHKGILTLVVGLVPFLSAAADVTLPRLLSENTVLQRNARIRIWGQATPGEAVRVECNGQTQTTQAGKDGNWQVFLEPMNAGGPYDMIVTGKNRIVVGNVLVGDVWICSGQSNMQMGLNSAEKGHEEVAAATYPKIRLFNVGSYCAAKPRNDVMGRWLECSPATARGFSAVAYFFGRKLHQDLDVPIGLIEIAWSGTPVQAWTNRDDSLALGDLKSVQAFRKDVWDIPEKRNELLKRLEDWHQNAYVRDPDNKGFGQGWAKPTFDAADWQTIDLPGMVEKKLGKDVDGAFWFRRTFDLPEDWTNRELVLQLGVIDDADVTYFNNEKIGQTGDAYSSAWNVPREYRIPAKLVHAGRNVIAVRVFDCWLNGGFGGTKNDLRLFQAEDQKKSISLAGPWRFKTELEVAARPKDVGPRTRLCRVPGALYNGMIAPVTKMTIRGAIWYQGEDNVGLPWEYRQQLVTLIRNWRRDWRQGDFPFLIVQLPNYREATSDANAKSSWAMMRDAQRQTLEEPNTAMAVTIDLGEAKNIHPRNKQDVGKRLALCALGKVYGQSSVVYAGPTYRSMSVEGNKVRLTFDDVDGGLVAKGDGELKGFAVAGDNGTFVWANAKIDGTTVLVWSESVPHPVKVRYAWADNPTCNLYNQAGLPACPFTAEPARD